MQLHLLSTSETIVEAINANIAARTKVVAILDSMVLDPLPLLPTLIILKVMESTSMRAEEDVDRMEDMFTPQESV